MENPPVKIELSRKQYLELVKLVYLGSQVVQEVDENTSLNALTEVQQKVFSASGPGKGDVNIAYDKAEDEYFLAEDLEDKLIGILDEYDESRFWESLIMRLTMRDLHQKFTDKELDEMTEEQGSLELERIHSYYINEFDENDLMNLKLVSMRKV